MGGLTDRSGRLARVLMASWNMSAAIHGRLAAGQENLYQEALDKLKQLSHEENIPIAIIGGAATIHHGYEYSTKDIDITVSVQDFSRIVKVAYKYGFDLTSYQDFGMHELDYKGIPIEVIQEEFWGPNEHNLYAPHSPQKMGVEKGMGFASLAYWVYLKLYAGRHKDITSVIEVIKNKQPRELQIVGETLYNLSPEYYDQFEKLIKEAQNEKSRERPRLSYRSRF